MGMGRGSNQDVDRLIGEGKGLIYTVSIRSNKLIILQNYFYMKALHMIAFILVVVGGLNWLLVALGWNLVEMIFGMDSMLTQIVYILVGLSAVYLVVTHKKTCRACSGGMM